MKVRTYKVAHNKDEETGRIFKFVITDVHDNEELQKGLRPDIAVFPICQLYDEEEQRYRAEHYCEYLNKIQEAKQTAYNGALLFDTIKQAEQ
jgi:hypothetical protein